ncbi:MAG: asparagine synthase (glutamine-hydrolyzing) [Flavobacteriales bacterium]|jgi:asparagine synthase (glutamine-hydrolysing)
MCGINGILGLEGINNPSITIEKMNTRLAHRGPDSEGVFVNDAVALGHRRLSIIDVSDAGNQPFHSADGKLTMVFNGEVYNYLELKAELDTSSFKTKTDTEVVLAAYAKWGIDFLSKLNGMFALAIWDEENRQLILARDRIGIKPLYYHIREDGVVFSSEIRSLIASELVPKNLDSNSVIDYLRYQTVHAPNTILEGVYMLEAGHFMAFTESEQIHQQYWDPSSIELIDAPRPELLSNIKEKLQRSVELRMRADVPFGAFLSGGIDSSAIVGLMSSVTEHPVSTFSVTFDESAFSEARYAQLIAKKFNTKHTEIKLSPNDFLELVPSALAAMDHPSGDGPNTYIVSKVTKESGITMALSGLGGDELFAGYSIFKQAVDLLDKRWLQSFPKTFRRAAGSAINLIKPGIASRKKAAILIQDYFDLEYIYPFSRLVLEDEQIKGLLNEPVKTPNFAHGYLKEILAPTMPGFKLPYLSKISLAEMGTYMQNVLLRDSDQMSMAHSLEVRVPFLDHNLVEYVLGINDQQKYPRTPKELMTEALGDLLPREIIDRPKMGFTLPWEHWMKNELKDFCSDRLAKLGKRPLFNEKGIEKLWMRFLKGDKHVTWSRVWPLVVLAQWLEDNQID